MSLNNTKPTNQSCKHTTCYYWKSFFFVPMVQILCDYIIIDTIRCQSDVNFNGIVSKETQGSCTCLIYASSAIITTIDQNYSSMTDGTLFKHIHKPCVLFGHIAIATAVISWRIQDSSFWWEKIKYWLPDKSNSSDVLFTVHPLRV